MRIVLMMILAFGGISLNSCNDSSGSSTTLPVARMIDELPGSCPNLTKNVAGDIVLSWIRELNDSSAVFCYAISTDEGKTFSAPVIVPGTGNIKPHSENIPKLLFKPSGEIIVVWGAASVDPRNKYSGTVFYTQSFDNGKTWSNKTPLVSDTASYDQRYFDLALLSNGEAAIIWLDNRSITGQDGSSLYFASTKVRSGFKDERLIAESCCQCCRTDLFIDKKDNIHVLYRGIIKDSIRDMVHSVSPDGGRTFSKPQRISNDNWVLKACPHTGPAMTENSEGIHFAWYTGGKRKGTFYTKSENNGKLFIMHDSIAGAGKHPQLAANKNGELAIVWDEFVKYGDQFYSRIGIQERTPKGENAGRKFLSPEGVNATYPVLQPVKQGGYLVAYCQEKDGLKFVMHQAYSGTY